MNTKNMIAIILFSCLSFFAKAQKINSQDVYDHIAYLADDKLRGRRTGSKGAKLAANYIAKHFKSNGVTPKGNNGYFHDISVRHKSNPHDKTSKDYETIPARNVVGFIDNNAKNTIVLGAHYDHLGLGHDANSREANSKGKIHNGADDNASGVAGLLELAKALKKNNIKENFNFLFIAFTGEELGLLGSKKWCDNPTIDMKSINYMLNMDMIGRLNPETKKLVISGVGTSDIWKETLEKQNDYFSLKLDSSGTGPSDHTSFYHHDIPVLHFFSGQHNDYHKSTDDIGKINIDGTKRIIEYIYSVLMETNHFYKLEFFKTKSKQKERTGAEYKVTLGIMPDYTAEVKGLRVDGVSSERPAENAGIKRGDIITQIGDVVIKDIYDYMKGLSGFKKGDMTKVKATRNGERLEFIVTF